MFQVSSGHTIFLVGSYNCEFCGTPFNIPGNLVIGLRHITYICCIDGKAFPLSHCYGIILKFHGNCISLTLTSVAWAFKYIYILLKCGNCFYVRFSIYFGYRINNCFDFKFRANRWWGVIEHWFFSWIV